MEQSLTIKLDIKKGDRTYSFIMPHNCPIGESYDAVFEVLNLITNEAQKTTKQVAPQEKE